MFVRCYYPFSILDKTFNSRQNFQELVGSQWIEDYSKRKRAEGPLQNYKAAILTKTFDPWHGESVCFDFVIIELACLCFQMVLVERPLAQSRTSQLTQCRRLCASSMAMQGPAWQQLNKEEDLAFVRVCKVLLPVFDP